MEQTMEPKKSALKNLLIVGCVGALAVALIIGLIAFNLVKSLSAPKDAARDFLEAAIAGDVSEAYTSTSTEFQQVTSEEDLSVFLQSYPVLAENTRLQFTNISIDNDTAVVWGEIEGGGQTEPITVQLVKEGGKWRVLNLSLEPEDVPESTSSDTSY